MPFGEVWIARDALVDDSLGPDRFRVPPLPFFPYPLLFLVMSSRRSPSVEAVEEPAGSLTCIYRVPSRLIMNIRLLRRAYQSVVVQ